MKTLLNHKESRIKDGIRVSIEIAINQSNHTYFSVCGEVHQMTDGRPRLLSGGQCTKEMREFFPEFHDFLNLHLSDLDGKPMYAMENGMYFLEHLHDTSNDYSILTIMKHFRISYQEAIELSIMKRDAQKERIESYYPRWKQEMNNAIERLEQLCGRKLILD